MTLFVKGRTKPDGIESEIELNATNLLVTKFHFTPQQFKETNRRPILSAPGADEFLSPVSGIVALKFGSQAYPVANISIEVGPNNSALYDNSFLTATSDHMAKLGDDTWNSTPENIINQPVYLVTRFNGVITDQWEVFAGGSGYAVNDTGTIDVDGTVAHYKVLSVSAGVVTAIEITTPGDGYVVGGQYSTTNTSPQAGSGSGLVLRPYDSDITGIDGDSDVFGSIVYYREKAKF